MQTDDYKLTVTIASMLCRTLQHGETTHEGAEQLRARVREMAKQLRDGRVSWRARKLCEACKAARVKLDLEVWRKSLRETVGVDFAASEPRIRAGGVYWSKTGERRDDLAMKVALTFETADAQVEPVSMVVTAQALAQTPDTASLLEELLDRELDAREMTLRATPLLELCMSVRGYSGDRIIAAAANFMAKRSDSFLADFTRVAQAKGSLLQYQLREAIGASHAELVWEGCASTVRARLGVVLASWHAEKIRGHQITSAVIDEALIATRASDWIYSMSETPKTVEELDKHARASVLAMLKESDT